MARKYARPSAQTQRRASLSPPPERDRGAVKRDVDALAKAGLLKVGQRLLPGHGRRKEVRVTAQHFKLEAALA